MARKCGAMSTISGTKDGGAHRQRKTLSPASAAQTRSTFLPSSRRDFFEPTTSPHTPHPRPPSPFHTAVRLQPSFPNRYRRLHHGIHIISIWKDHKLSAISNTKCRPLFIYRNQTPTTIWIDTAVAFRLALGASLLSGSGGVFRTP